MGSLIIGDVAEAICEQHMAVGSVVTCDRGTGGGISGMRTDGVMVGGILPREHIPPAAYLVRTNLAISPEDNLHAAVHSTLRQHPTTYLPIYRQRRKQTQQYTMADLPLEFNVQEGNGNGYNDFILQLRELLSNPGMFSHNRPVLRPQQRPPNQWLDIVLRRGSRSVRLRIQMDNIYLIGYQANNHQWFELNNEDNAHFIAGATWLGYNGGYDALEGAARRGRDAVNLGQQQLITAVNQLAAAETERSEIARSLMIIIQMVCESARFAEICNFYTTHFAENYPPTPKMIALENGWGNLSAALLQADNNPEEAFPFRIPNPNTMEITTAQEAAAVLGILCCSFVPRPRRTLEPTAVGGLFPQGRALVEVLWVRIENIDNENPGDLYGSIIASDGWGRQYVYHRVRDDYDSVRPGEKAPLTGPSRAISAAGSFSLELDLRDEDADLSPDDEVSKGYISWNVYDATIEYDELRSATVSGRYGSATVSYVVMSDAAEALVEVILVNGDGEDPADVYGSITAQTVYGESELFRREAGRRIQVRPRARIPLLRSVVAVPMDSNLVIKADLMDHDAISYNDEIAKGTAEFRPLVHDSAKASIRGKYGEIEVRVTWS